MYAKKWYASNKARYDTKKKLWRARNPDKVREYKRKNITGWSNHDIATAWTAQHGRCAICSQRMTKDLRTSKSACPDHNHSTGAKRELLCCSCNTSLGFIERDQKVALAMFSYLAKHESI